jgi:hypothetical protein
MKVLSMREKQSVPFVLFLAGCAGAGGAAPTMVHLPPPPAWEESLLEARSRKDEMFRVSPESPLLPADRAAFESLDYWPPRPEYYVVGSIDFYPQPQPLEMVTTAGQLRPAERVGSVRFELHGAMQRLEVYRLRDSAEPESFFLPFMDGTTGRETYPAGRYVELQGPPGGAWVLDFNTAYNPSCAYGAPERFACPVTPAENRLSVRVEAGERGYKASPS